VLTSIADQSLMRRVTGENHHNLRQGATQLAVYYMSSE
jgi:hypothetical protein